MNKKIIRFSKIFIPCVILSIALIVFGIFGFFTKGLNMGLDFKAGLIEDVSIAPAAIEISYTGAASVTVEISNIALKVIISGVGAENTTIAVPYAAYRTIGEVVDFINSIGGIKARALASRETTAVGMFGNSAVSNVLSSSPYRLHYTNSETRRVSVDEVRSALAAVPNSSVKVIGDPQNNTFQIRVGDEGNDREASKTIQTNINTALVAVFGAENTAVLKTDFIGAQFSTSLAIQAAVLMLATILLIWLYATVRFQWDFALGAVLAIIHDALIMLAFIIWTGLEFNATMIAALLTIIGYSINDTVVVLDRVRENIRILKVKKFKDILDVSQTEILGRTIITSVTTLLAVSSLYLFTTGSMKEFAFALIIGMISGVYSTIFITSSFIALVRRNWKPSDEEKKTQIIEVNLEG